MENENEIIKRLTEAIKPSFQNIIEYTLKEGLEIGYNKALEDIEELISEVKYETNSDLNNFTTKFIELKKEKSDKC